MLKRELEELVEKQKEQISKLAKDIANMHDDKSLILKKNSELGASVQDFKYQADVNRARWQTSESQRKMWMSFSAVSVIIGGCAWFGLLLW